MTTARKPVKKKPRVILLAKVERWHARDKVWDVSFRAPTLKELLTLAVQLGNK